jgi:serine phosphatase RsbU (regulator of sigma subunit)
MLSGIDGCATVTRTGDGEFELHSSYGLDSRQVATLTQAAKRQGSGWTEEAGADRSVADSTPIPLGSMRPAAFSSPVGLLAPVYVGDDLRCVLAASLTGPSGSLHIGTGPSWDRSTAIVEAITRGASAALEYHDLLRSLREEAYVSAALVQTARTVAGLGSLEEILSVVCRLPSALIGAEKCLIFSWLQEQETFDCMQAFGLTDQCLEQLASSPLTPERVPLLWLLRLEQQSEDDAAGSSRRPLRRRSTTVVGALGDYLGLDPGGDSTVVGVPLVVKGSFVGALVLTESAEAPGTSPRRAEILQGIADQAAIAIQNDRLQAEATRRQRLEQEMRLAHQIQMRLMAEKLPEVAGWELAAACVPARDVGGDFYDVFELPGDRLGIVVADVADKGMPAALFMANTRAMIRALAAHYQSPTDVLAEVNRLLVPDSYQGMFVTVFYAVLSPAEALLTYCNAGHHAPIACHGAETGITRLAGHGTALAVLDRPTLDEHTAAMMPGQALVLYTDGITDAYGGEQQGAFGEEGLCTAIRGSVARSAADMVDAILGAASEFAAKTPQFDDQTLVVIKRRSGPRA